MAWIQSQWAEFPWGAALTFAALIAAVVLLALDERNRRKFATREQVVDGEGKSLFVDRDALDASLQRIHRRIDESDGRCQGTISLFTGMDDRLGALEEKAARIEERQSQQWERTSEQMSQTASMIKEVAAEMKEISRTQQDLAVRMERVNQSRKDAS